MIYQKKGLLLFVLLLMLSAASFFLLKNSSFKADATVNEVAIPTPKYPVILNQEAKGEKLVVNDFGTIGSPGDPNLPVKTVNLLLPPDAEDSTVEATLVGSQTIELGGNHEIAPSPPLAISLEDGKVETDWGEGKKIEADKNLNIYKKDALYPDKNIEVVSVGSMRQYKIARVKFYPFQYNPVTKKIIRTSGGQINLTYKQVPLPSTSVPGVMEPSAPAPSVPRGDDASSSEDPFKDILPSLVNNPEGANNWYPKQDKLSHSFKKAKAESATTKGGLLIVTTNAIVSGSKQLATFKTNKENLGYGPVTIVTEAQWGGGTGNAASDKLRSYLKTVYSKYKYILLIGNPDPSKGDVPMKMTWPRKNSTTYQEAPTDYVYADLSSNWDTDGDGFWGEQQDLAGIDLFPEILVGRIPVYGNITDLDNILQKTIAYENGDLKSDWIKRVMVAMKPSDANTPGYYLGEAIKKDVATPANMQTTRVYEEGYGLNPGPEYTPTLYDNVTKALGATHPGFLFWWTHGNETLAAEITSTQRAATFSDDINNHPFFTFQVSCLNAYPERTDNLAYALLKRGSIVTNAATRVSWYYPGQVDYAATDSNAGMAYQYSKYLVKNHLSAGASHYATLTTIPNDIWMNHLVFNLYGDPSISYKEKVGPTIQTTSLIDTDNTTSPYNISANIFSSFPLTASPSVKWNTDESQNYQTIVMTKGAGTNEYTAQIPAQSFGKTVHYYIEATDTKGTQVMPTTSPLTPYSYKVAQDTIAPTVTLQPLIDTGFTTGPYIIAATAKDERLLGNVKLYYSINGGPDNELVMQNMGGDVFQAEIPGPMEAGDAINYRVVAEDASLNKNKASYPPSGNATFNILPVRKVVVYNNSANPPYFFGGNSNIYQAVSDILTSDPQMRYSVSIATKLDAGSLAGKDVLILPDNAPSNEEFQPITDWYKTGKEIITLDNAATYAAASGFLWGNTTGTNGYNTVWDSGLTSQNDQLIKLADPITSKYKVGDIIDSRGYTTSFIVNAIPSDTKILSVSDYNPGRAYAIYRDTPNAGRIVAFGPFVPLQQNQYNMIRDAAYSVSVDVPTPPKDTTPPSTPANLRLVSKSDNAISIAWDPSTDNLGVAGYKVYRKGLEVGNVSVTAFSDTGLIPNTSYTYEASSYDAAGNFSGKSTALTVLTNATPADTIAPSVPQNLKLLGAGTTDINFMWDKSTDNVAVAGYKVLVNGQEKASTVADNYSIPSLTPNTSYSLTVLAYDPTGNSSAQSAPLAVKTLSDDKTAPSTPTNLVKGIVTSNSISLSWAASTDNVGVSGYNIYENNAKIGSSTAMSFTHTGLDADTIYEYNVTAVDAAGNESAKSSLLSVKTQKAGDTTAPSVPTGLKLVSKSTTSANISWTASTDNVGVIGYKIYKNDVETGTSASTSFSSSGLTAGTTYAFAIAAFDAAGNVSAKSAPLSVTTNSLTPANTQLSIQVLSSANYIYGATVQLIVNGQVSQTAAWNYRLGLYTFPQYVQKNATHTVKIQATGFTTQTIQVDTSNATLKPGTTNVYTKTVKVTMAKASTFSKAAGAFSNSWQRFLGLFKR